MKYTASLFKELLRSPHIYVETEGADVIGEEEARRLFSLYFLENSDFINHLDDLLFFVQREKDENNKRVQIRRRSRSFSLSIISPLDTIYWKETLLLNTISQLYYLLVFSICSKTNTGRGPISTGGSSMQVVRQIRKRVYATPSKTRLDKKGDCYEETYPFIYFIMEDFGETFRDTVLNRDEYLCIELSVSIDPSLNTSTCNASEGEISIFKGAVSYPALLEASLNKTDHSHKKTRQGESQMNFILMRGPRGRGHAQVAVNTETKEDRTSTRSSLQVLKSLWETWYTRGTINGGEKDPPLVCRLTFINIHWKTIMSDILNRFCR